MEAMFAAIQAYVQALFAMLPHLITLVMICLFVLLVATMCFDNEYLVVGIIVTFFTCITFCMVVMSPMYYQESYWVIVELIAFNGKGLYPQLVTLYDTLDHKQLYIYHSYF